jgi:NADPH:quinone reductase-like Zn-dependent oxidoreductase
MNVGALAEETVVPAMLCMKKPSTFTHAEAAAVFVGFMTAYHG